MGKYDRVNLDPESPLRDRNKAKKLYEQMNELAEYLFVEKSEGKESSNSDSNSPRGAPLTFALNPLKIGVPTDETGQKKQSPATLGQREEVTYPEDLTCPCNH